MQIGDLTSGVSMLPDNSLNKGIQDYFKQEISISAQKGQLAQNKINQVNKVLDVNLKGLQSQDMNEAVAARDKLVNNAMEYARNSKDLGDIPWHDMQKLRAEKANLEQMVQQSHDTQALYKERYNQGFSIKDEGQREQYFKDLSKVNNLPNISARNQYLNNLTPPVIQYSNNDIATEIRLVSSKPTPQNKHDLRIITDNMIADNNYKMQSLREQWDKRNPKGTDDEFRSAFYKNMEARKLGGLTPTQKTAMERASKNIIKRTVIRADTPGGSVYSFSGVGKIKKLGDVPIPGEVGKDYPNATLLRIQPNKKTGKMEALISYSTTEKGGSSFSLPGGGLSITLNTGGGRKGSATATVPLSVLRNAFTTNNIHFKDKKLEDFIYNHNVQIKNHGVDNVFRQETPIAQGVVNNTMIK